MLDGDNCSEKKKRSKTDKGIGSGVDAEVLAMFDKVIRKGMLWGERFLFHL